MSEASHPTWTGRTLGGRYRIESLLGRGGMSTVYKATDPNLQRTVAVKLIHPHLSEQPHFLKRFEQEAAAVAKLRHPNIIQVHDFSRDGDTYYMVLEHVHGETLEQRLAALKEANMRLPVEEAIRTMIALCDAVAYAHAQKMVHRDLKPSNVIIDLLGRPILMDFGIAKIVGGGQVQTATGATIGTAAYMSPEQVIGESVDHRADIYSLGVMLYEMAGGKPPFEGKSALTVMMKHVNEPVPDIRLLNSNVPDVLLSVLEKALAKDPKDRYQSAVEMATALRNVGQQIGVTTGRQSFAGTPTLSGSPAGPAGQPSSAPKRQTTPDATVVVPGDDPSDSLPKTARDANRTGSEDRSTTGPAVKEEPAGRPARPVARRTLAIVAALLVGLCLLLLVGLGAVVNFLIPGLPALVLGGVEGQTLPTSAGMVRIPAGIYTIGSTASGREYVPVRQVELAEFWLDRFQVTNAQYAEFVAATGAQTPSAWPGGSMPPGQESHPVQGVTWNVAQAYCQWLDKRLPREAEWEVAARGPQALLYPWGNDEGVIQLSQRSTHAVGSVPANRSAFGLYDMAGNVWEWVDEPYAPIPEGQRILRGGAYDFQKDMAYRLQGNPNAPTMVATAGFRCAADEVEVVPDETILLTDDFTNPESGWPAVNEGGALSGYHPPDYYHLQSSQTNYAATAFYDRPFGNVTVEATVFVDSTDTEDGDFRYGLALRRSGDNYYAFTISPRTGNWAVLKSSTGQLALMAQGTIGSLQGLTTADSLRVDASGADFSFAINGQVVVEVNDPDYASGDVGFFVETFDESRAHIHFGSLTVREAEYVAMGQVLLHDNFIDPASGWPVFNDGRTLSGYHPPDYYHVQSSEPHHRSTAFYNQVFDDFTLEVEVFVDSTDTGSGDFFYGLAVRQEGDNYYAFTISPRSQTWQIFKNSQAVQEVLAQGQDHSIQGLTASDRLRVDAAGPDLIFHINNHPIAHVVDGDYSRGNVGFIVETLDESRAHIHYDTLTVRRVEVDPEAAPLTLAPTGAPDHSVDPTPAETDTPEATVIPEGPLPSSQGMVKVDAGAYMLVLSEVEVVGSDIAVELDEFWIDRFETTNATYADFLEASGQGPPDYWQEHNVPAEMGDHPVRGITWDLAAAYCEWAGKRLPTEAEWEAAARGPHGWRYPWGNNSQAVELPGSGTYAVGTLPENRSFFGAFDMAGNVWEWVDEPYRAVPAGERVLRGGANNFQNDMTFRLAGRPDSSTMIVDAGVRCAASHVEIEEETDVLLHDDFADLDSGWWQARAPADAYFYGYHPTDFYHVQVSAADDCLSVHHDRELDNVMAEVQIFIAATETTDGDFNHGLTLRQADTEFYAFVVSPRRQEWQVLKSTAAGLALMDEGSSDTIQGDSEATRDRLFVIANGPEFTFFVNGELVSRVYDADYPGGNVGFIVQTLNETYAHIHYDSITVWQLPAGVSPTARPPLSIDYPIRVPLCRGSVSAADTLVSFISHTVVANETLSEIARRYGVTVEDILGANGRTIQNPGLIRTGQTLVIPQP